MSNTLLLTTILALGTPLTSFEMSQVSGGFSLVIEPPDVEFASPSLSSIEFPTLNPEMFFEGIEVGYFDINLEINPFENDQLFISPAMSATDSSND